ncbi:hypothetical protein [Candidatus Thiodiazotropha sp. CDECU1]|uniref:hypothetical protein n=1 Tax=Candidatus Thiodiazotropha sp. CDECU1 TaxID=3065865 RepID=UPI00292CA9A9|nr:hypothetical protein [Candidatus Thiodiazotropha sp. CDECU1]
MKHENMIKAKTVFQKGAAQMIASGVDPADVSAALVGAGTAISVDVDGPEATVDWLIEDAQSIKKQKSAVTIN